MEFKFFLGQAMSDQFAQVKHMNSLQSFTKAFKVF